MNPPVNGALNGPTKTVNAYTEIATPRYVLLKTSANTPGTTVNWLAAHIPAKNRHIISVWISLATALPMVKIPPPSMAIVTGHLRPLISEAGAQIRGPELKPSTYSVVPSVPTSELTPNSLLAESIPGAKTALVKETMNVPEHTRIDEKSLGQC